MESRRVKKRYIAILHGRLEDTGDRRSRGTWRWPLSKGAGGRRNPRGKGPGQPCETQYRVLGHSVHYTLVEIELLTGRKHQIRRHARMAGHPVVGDRRYGSKRAMEFLTRNFGFNRLGLHTRALTLQLPGGEDLETIETPVIPTQMKALFDNDL